MKPNVSLDTIDQLHTIIDSPFDGDIDMLCQRGIKNQLLSVQWLAGQLQISERQLLRIIKKRTGKTTHDFLNEYKLKIAKDLLLTNRRVSVKIVSSTLLFSDSKYFSRLYKKRFGYNPSQTIKYHHEIQQMAKKVG